VEAKSNRKLAQWTVIASLAWGLSPATFGQVSGSDSNKQTVVTATPDAEQILNRYVEAAGGRKAWLKIQSRVSMGKIEVTSMSLSGTVLIHEKAPNRVLTTIILAGSAFRQGFDGTVGWTDDPQDGLREQTGAELLEVRRQADFYSPLDLHDTYKKFNVRGSDKVGAHDVFVVEAFPSDGGDPDTMFFDTQTGFPIRIVGERHTPDGTLRIEEEFEDYREVDGIKLPFTIRQTSAESSFTMKLNEVRHNVDLDDSEFRKPVVQ
jgi:zinc protease